MTELKDISFIDLQSPLHRLRPALMAAIERVIDRGDFIMGREVGELETQLSEYCVVRHAITCSSGTDALLLSLMALGVGPGDAVLLPAFTFVAPAEAVALLGATPVFCDVDTTTFNIDAESIASGIDSSKTLGLRPVVLIAVDLFGTPAPYASLRQIASENDMWLVADAAQSFGASIDATRVASFADVTTTSFFPAKPLGCLGDGGAVFTEDDDIAETVRSLRLHGQGSRKYEHVRLGINGRLDTIQAAVLLERLSVFDDELGARQGIARRYVELLSDWVDVPLIPDGVVSSWAQFTIRSPFRERIRSELGNAHIPTAVHYPAPLTQQPAFRRFPVATGGVPSAEELADTVLSLPMHPYLDDRMQAHIVDSVRAAVEGEA